MNIAASTAVRGKTATKSVADQPDRRFRQVVPQEQNYRRRSLGNAPHVRVAFFLLRSPAAAAQEILQVLQCDIRLS
jgi:hypothetical protein